MQDLDAVRRRRLLWEVLEVHRDDRLGLRRDGRGEDVTVLWIVGHRGFQAGDRRGADAGAVKRLGHLAAQAMGAFDAHATVGDQVALGFVENPGTPQHVVELGVREAQQGVA